AFPAQRFGSAPTSLAGNELVAILNRRLPRLALSTGAGTNQDWRAQPARPKRFDQLLLRRVVKPSTVLVGRWLDRSYRDELDREWMIHELPPSAHRSLASDLPTERAFNREEKRPVPPRAPSRIGDLLLNSRS